MGESFSASVRQSGHASQNPNSPPLPCMKDDGLRVPRMSSDGPTTTEARLNKLMGLDLQVVPPFLSACDLLLSLLVTHFATSFMPPL
jgi:hypothetical protein